MLCKVCQADNPAGQRFCGQCAASLDSSAPQPSAKPTKEPEKIGPKHLVLIALVLILICIYQFGSSGSQPTETARPTSQGANGAWEGKIVSARIMHVCGGDLSDAVMAHNAGVDKDSAGLKALLARGKVVVISPGDKAIIILTREYMARVRWTSGAAIGQRCWSPIAALN